MFQSVIILFFNALLMCIKFDISHLILFVNDMLHSCGYCSNVVYFVLYDKSKSLGVLRTSIANSLQTKSHLKLRKKSFVKSTSHI